MITRTVTGTWLGNDLTPRSGDVEFQPTVYLIDTVEKDFITTSGITVDLDENGQIEIDLQVTDDETIDPEGWLWSITERIDGQENRTWQFSLLEAGVPLDLADAVPATVPPDYTIRHQDVSVGAAPILDATNFTNLPGAVSGVRTQAVRKTADYTMTGADHVCICTANSFTVTLPTAYNQIGKQYIIKNVGSGTITVDGDGSETIDGESSIDIVQWDSYTFVSDDFNWIIV